MDLRILPTMKTGVPLDVFKHDASAFVRVTVDVQNLYSTRVGYVTVRFFLTKHFLIFRSLVQTSQCDWSAAQSRRCAVAQRRRGKRPPGRHFRVPALQARCAHQILSFAFGFDEIQQLLRLHFSRYATVVLSLLARMPRTSRIAWAVSEISSSSAQRSSKLDDVEATWRSLNRNRIKNT